MLAIEGLSDLVSIWRMPAVTSITTSNANGYQSDAIKVDRGAIGHKTIDAYIVALGSNYEAEKNLAIARSKLETLACDVQWSSLLVNPDYTASKKNPKPDYTNQCGVLILKSALPFQTLQTNSKRIERSCKRLLITDEEGKLSEPDRGRVSIDIDILAVSMSGQWSVINQRYPFKAHEVIGIRELAS